MTWDKLLAKVPQQWLPLVRPFLLRAHEFEGKEPLVAYYVCTHVAFICMRLRKKEDKEGTAFLMALLDALEASKVQLGEKIQGVDGRTVLTKYALMLFASADDAERTGNASLAIVRLFYTSSILFEATAQFTEDGAMDSIAAEKCKYAKYIATRMKKSLDMKTPYASPNKLEMVDDGVTDEARDGDCAKVPGQSGAFTTAPASCFTVPSTSQPTSGSHRAPVPSASQTNTSVPSYVPPPITVQPPMPPPPPPYTFEAAGQGNNNVPMQSPSTMNAYAPPQPPQPPAQQPQTTTSHNSSGGNGFKPSVDQMIDAQKLASQAVSALQFYDHETAKQRLIAALRILNGVQ